MDYFTKWPKVYAIPNQDATTVADALEAKFFCRFGVPMELHSDQSRKFESRLMQEVLERLGFSKSKNTPTPAVRWNGGKIREEIEEHLRKVVSNHHGTGMRGCPSSC